MKAVGGGDFTSPFFSEAQANGSGYIRLSGFNPDGTPITTQVADKLAYRAQGLLTKYTEEIQNLGIPGMRLDLGAVAPTFSSANMYFERLLPTDQVGDKTYIDFIQNRNHTFFSVWLGNNDVLGWAMAGGVAGVDPTKQLTNATSFTGLYNQYIAALTAQGQKGVVATIPDVTSIPFFNTVTVSAINAALAADPDVPASNNKLIIRTGTGVPREATPEDLIVLNFDRALLGVNGYGLSPLNPMESQYVLDRDEVATAKQRVIDFNNSIKAVAEAKDLAVVDTYTILNGIKTPANYDGILVSSAFITGNAFSLDGVHLTPIGNAIIANEFIKAINKKYNSNIPTVAVSMYSGVRIP